MPRDFIHGYSQSSISANIASFISKGMHPENAKARAYKEARKAFRRQHRHAPYPSYIREVNVRKPPQRHRTRLNRVGAGGRQGNDDTGFVRQIGRVELFPRFERADVYWTAKNGEEKITYGRVVTHLDSAGRIVRLKVHGKQEFLTKLLRRAIETHANFYICGLAKGAAGAAA